MVFLRMPIQTDIDLLQSVPYKRSQNILKNKKLKLTTQMSGIFSSFNPIHGGEGSGGRWAGAVGKKVPLPIFLL